MKKLVKIVNPTREPGSIFHGKKLDKDHEYFEYEPNGVGVSPDHDLSEAKSWDDDKKEWVDIGED